MSLRRWHFFQRTYEPLAVLDADYRLIEANPAFYRAMGYQTDQSVQAPLIELLLPADRAPALQALAQLKHHGHICFQARAITMPQHWMQWLISADTEDGIAYVVAHDITRQQQADVRLSMLQVALEYAADAVLIVELLTQPDDPKILYSNAAMSAVSGYPTSALHGAPISMLTGLQADYKTVCGHVGATRNGEIISHAITFYRPDKSTYQAECRLTPLYDNEGRLTHLVMLQQASSRPLYHPAELRYQIQYDQVTGLLNRSGLINRLDGWINEHNGKCSFAICLFDLDRFNRINDALGHNLGDELLAAVGDRLRAGLPHEALLARMGGDEFAVITSAADDLYAYQIARQMLQALEQPFVAGEHRLYLSAGAGISLYPRDGDDAGTLLKHADSAMHLAKSQGRNTVRIFTPELAGASQARLELDMQLRHAIEVEEFVLYYQPQIDLRTGKVVGVESLIRWQHPSRGLLTPGAFIAAAEESHLMPRLARWVIQESCRQAVRWQKAGHPPIRMAVNVSAPQFEVDDIVTQVAEALSVSGLAPCWFDLEITESMLMRNPEDSAAKIARLRALGARVTIDDFGTGYSSLAYLQQFPVDTLKIDRSFVREINGDENDTALIQAIVGLAHSLGLSVVAEGVETPLQHAYLREIGCDEAQGYLFAYPLPADHVWPAIRHLDQIPLRV
ncbi:MAG: EAL domain-containing protein [Oscillochloris sp.]|nr:EAL domain-containing protein [Oscillochloris sp.]